MQSNSERSAGYELLQDIRFTVDDGTGSEGECEVCACYSKRMFEVLGGPDDIELWVCGSCFGLSKLADRLA